MTLGMMLPGVGGIIITVLGIMAGLFLYFLPAIIGMNKIKKQQIFWINLLLGWTVLGWIGSLIWGITSPVKREEFAYVCSKCGFSKSFEQKLKLYKCSQCGNEHMIE